MPKIDPALKQMLLDGGRWTEFVRYRQDLKKSGVDNVTAHGMAMDQFFDNPPALQKGLVSVPPLPNTHLKVSIMRLGGGVKEGSETEAVGVSPPSSPAAEEDGGDSGLSSEPGPSPSFSPTFNPSFKYEAVEKPRRGRPRKGEERAAPKNYKPMPNAVVARQVGNLPDLPPVVAVDFEGKQASEVEVVRWVAANMEITDPKPADCPSAAAWGLLAQCRSSPVARGEFWKQTYPKLLPSRTQMEMEQDAVPDESKAKEVIEELLRFGREAENGGKAIEPVIELAEKEEVAEEGAIREEPGNVQNEEVPVPGPVIWREGDF